MSCGRIRRLTPTECARLQTIPEWYQWKCSDTQQYRMLGNGWTVEVIVHIFSFLKDNIHINIAWQQAETKDNELYARNEPGIEKRLLYAV